MSAAALERFRAMGCEVVVAGGDAGSFVDTDGAVVENEAWAGATREVPACI